MNPSPSRPRLVRCPRCGQPTAYAPENPARPFCSLRCRSSDLGAWAAEGYRVTSPPSAEDIGPAAEWPPEARH